MKTIPDNMTHAVVYTGAPYGDGEGGHIVSLHKSQQSAVAAADHYRQETAIALDEPYRSDGKTAREYFAA